MTEPAARRITWFDPPDRPVEGNTIYVRPAADQPDPPPAAEEDS